jgi:hypothetical protein
VFGVRELAPAFFFWAVLFGQPRFAQPTSMSFKINHLQNANSVTPFF